MMLSLHSIYAPLDYMSQCAIPLRPHCLELDAKLIRDAVDHRVHLPIPISHPAGSFEGALIWLFPSLFPPLRRVGRIVAAIVGHIRHVAVRVRLVQRGIPV
jgi:hypothetical protein